MLTLATHNPNKVSDFRAFFPEGFPLRDMSGTGAPEPDETGTTFEENVTIKALSAAYHVGGWVLAEDSGFCVEALHGAPGVYTADWMREGPNPSSLKGIRKIRDAIAEVGAFVNGPASAVSVLMLVSPDGDSWMFRGEVHGTFCWPPRGDKGWGLEPAFVPNGSNGRTLAEMDQVVRQLFSHRGRSVARLMKSGLLDHMILDPEPKRYTMEAQEMRP